MGWSGRAPAPLLEKLAGGSKLKEQAMSQKLNSAIAVIGIGIGKNSFHIVGQDKRGAIVLRQKWSRGQVEARLANMLPCLIGMEACVGAHHLSRNLQALGKRRAADAGEIRTPVFEGTEERFVTIEAYQDRLVHFTYGCHQRIRRVWCKLFTKQYDFVASLRQDATNRVRDTMINEKFDLSRAMEEGPCVVR
jgi:hypothetical protein